MILGKEYKNHIFGSRGMINAEIEYQNEKDLEEGINFAIYKDGRLEVNIVIPKEDVFAIISKLVSDKCDNLVKELICNE